MEVEENTMMKRRRVARACDSCRRKKVRCDGVQPESDPPSCTNCKMNGFDCSFIDAPKKRGPPKGYIEALETRLQRMESVLSGLVRSGEVPEGSLPANLEWINVNETNYRSLDPSALHQSSGYKSKSRAGGSTTPQNGHDADSYRSAPGSDSDDSDGFDEDASSGDKDETDGAYDLNDSLGQLAIDETGMTRYLGSSSGVWLLKYTQQLARGQAILVNRQEWQEPSETKPKSPEIYVLPPRELCDQMVDTYFNVVNSFIPFLDKADFMEKYHDLENNPQILIVLYAMMSLTARFINDPSVRRKADDPSTAGADYIERTRDLLKEEFDDPTLYTLQALLLLSICQQSTKNSRSWAYSGMAIRIAQDMGLHRDSSKWNFDSRQAEVRKRVWWACFISDRGIGAGLGRPLVIQESDCDVPLPTPGVLPEENSETVAEFILTIRLARIMGHVLQHSYGIKASDSETVLMKLNGELDAWRDSLPERLRYDPAMTFQDLRNQRVAAFHLMFSTIQILLHRPHIRGPNSKGTPPKLPSLTICTMAANNITHCAYRAMKEDALVLWWNHTLYSFFTAAVMHVINALSGDERFREVAKHGLRMSLKCLEYLKPYCCSAEKCIMVIRHLLKVREINLDNVTLAGDTSSKDNGRVGEGPESASSLKLFCGVPASTDVSLSEQQQRHQRQHLQQQQTNRTILFAPSVSTQEATDINAMNSAEYSQVMAQQMASAMVAMTTQNQGNAGLMGSNNSSPQQLPSPVLSSNNTSFGMPLQPDIFNQDGSVFFPTNADQLSADARPLVLTEDVGSIPITVDWNHWSEYLQGVGHTGGLVNVGGISDTHLGAANSVPHQPEDIPLLGRQL